MVDSLLERYDIFYTNPSAAQLGFMLAKNKAGLKAWRRDDTTPLPESYAFGDVSYANLSPDIQKVISQRFLHGGLGALEFEVDDDAAFQILRYLKSQNIDCRCKGKAYPGPQINSLTRPLDTAPVLVDGGLELWDDGTTISAPWIASSTVVRTTSPKQAGTYSCQITDGNILQTIAWDAAYKGRKITLTAYTYGNDTTTSLIRINDGITDAYSTYHTGGNAWQARSATKNMSNAATALVVYGMNQDGHDNCYFDTFALTGTTIGAGVHFAVFNDEKYASFGAVLSKLNAGGTAYDVVYEFDNVITHLAVWGDYLLIAFAKANFYYYMDTAEAFTLSNLADGKADRFCKVGTSLWRLQLPNDLRVSANPLNGGSWGAAVTCGESAYNVNDMWEHDSILHALKEDGVYYYNSTDVAFYASFPELASIAYTDSGKNSTVFRDGLYFRMGNQQLWEIKDSVLTEITPSLMSQGISAYAYPIVALTHDESWLYAIIKRGAGDLAILAGRWEYIAGATRWIWHEIRSIDLTDVSTALVCSVEGRPYLYIGSTETDENVYKVYLPITNDATADSGYRFYTAGSLWTPRYMTLLYAVDKRWQELFARSVNLSAANYINAYYSVNDGSSFTLLHKLDTSPEQTESLTAIESTMMNLRFDFVGDSATVPPVLKYHNLKALTLMNSVSKFTHTIKCDNGLRLKSNLLAPHSYTYDAIRTFIDTIRDEICTLGDVSGTEHTVRVRVLKEETVFDEDEKRPALHYTIEATKLG